MTNILTKFQKLQFSDIIHRSNFIRVFCLLLLFTFYYLLISPSVEKLLTNIFAHAYRESSFSEVNSLTPIFNKYVYASEYDLATSTQKGNSISNTKFHTLDPRILAMNKFLKNYHSPMASHADTFVKEADRNGLDWRLLVSISGVESAFGNLIPTNSNNAWGWRGINGNDAGWSMFSSWEDAIVHITERLATGYGTTITPFEMEATYCPPCGRNPAHVWANGVTNYMNQLSYYLDNLSQL